MSTMQPYHYTNQLPASLYRAAQTRELDRITIEEEGVPGFELMSRAGRVAFDVLKRQWPGAGKIVVFCGVGNNGGDGYIVASLAKRSGMDVRIIQVGDPAKLKNDALLAFGQAQADQVNMVAFEPDQPLEGDLLVDALLGTGLSGEVRENHHQVIQAMNSSGLPILAIDIPSGLCSDTGRVLGIACHADATVTFIGVKQGLLTGRGPQYCGEIYYGSLAVPEQVFAKVPAQINLVQPQAVKSCFPARPRDAHKGQHGHVLVVGGDLGMGGAVAMAAEAAGRCGAGLVTVITRPEHVAALLARRPECMVLGCDEGSNIASAIEKASVIVAGPGIGRGRWGAFLLEQVLATELPVVLDADGLNYLSALAEQSPGAAERGNWVLTPHPGEAARLLRCEAADIQQDRFAALDQLSNRFSGAVLLKGAGTLVRGHGKLAHLVTTGNPGMAAGGMGDVLSGVIGALIAQGFDLESAAYVGAWIHGKAADIAVASLGERGLLATDLMLPLRQLVNGIGIET